MKTNFGSLFNSIKMIELADEPKSSPAKASTSISVPQPSYSRPLSVDFIKTTSPQKQSYCEKEDNSLLSYWLPWLFPRWKTRYLIVCGNYLFRYAGEDSDSPKGVPIPLDVSQISYTQGNELTLTNLWKDYKFKFADDRICKGELLILYILITVYITVYIYACLHFTC